MRKFTKVFKSVIERDIERVMDEESKANQIEAQNKIKVVQNQKGEKNASESTSLLKKMKDDKSDFLKKHAVNNVSDELISTALKGMKNIPSVISLPQKKREADEDVEELENKVHENQHHGKRGKKVRRS